jgi:hypothetical protein
MLSVAKRAVVIAVAAVLTVHIALTVSDSSGKSNAQASFSRTYATYTKNVSFDRAHSAMSVSSLRSFRNFPLYWLGTSVEGFPLRVIGDRLDKPFPGETHRANYISFIYGACQTPFNDGCAAPVEVQVWPACERALADYRLYPDGPALPHEDLTVRGAPAAAFDDGRRLELYSGRVTIVIFGYDADAMKGLASHLRGANNGLGEQDDLPPPAAGSRSGSLQCTDSEVSR